MTEWEQLKNEYREIPIPAEGKQQLLQTMAAAKRKRNRLKNLAGYGTLAAAAMLAVVMIPGMMLFSGGFGSATNEEASMKMDCAAESTQSAGWFYVKTENDMEQVPATGNMASTEGLPNYVMSDSADESYEVKKGETDRLLDESDAGVPWAEKREEISREILRQMEERMQSSNDTYYRKSEEYPEGFELINEEQAHYYTEDWLLVIVFEAGEVAPEEQGVIEFIIPAEVFSPIE